jgi:hypothetical protein
LVSVSLSTFFEKKYRVNSVFQSVFLSILSSEIERNRVKSPQRRRRRRRHRREKDLANRFRVSIDG